MHAVYEAAERAFTDADAFVSASVSGPGVEGTKITIRPVHLKTGRRLQFSRFDGRSTNVINLDEQAAAERFHELLTAGAGTVFVKTLAGDLQVTHSRKGVPRLVRHRASATEIDVAHDREKTRIVEPSAPYLHAVGITDADGRVKPTASGKFRQVERFVEILSHTLERDPPEATERIHAVDLGCGAGILTLATYDHLVRTYGAGVTMTGVDTKGDLMARLTRTARDLGWQGLTFETGAISNHRPVTPAQLVVALHACDTATDDALAQAIRWESRYVLAAPCCQHDLQAQIERSRAPEAYAPMLRHGIVRERLGDLLTDSLRAEIMRANGYRTDVIEFVSTEHTGKNLMIRGVRTGRPDDAAAAAAERLASEWSVTPALARALATT